MWPLISFLEGHGSGLEQFFQSRKMFTKGWMVGKLAGFSVTREPGSSYTPEIWCKVCRRLRSNEAAKIWKSEGDSTVHQWPYFNSDSRILTGIPPWHHSNARTWCDVRPMMSLANIARRHIIACVSFIVFTSRNSGLNSGVLETAQQSKDMHRYNEFCLKCG
jgi:hypothetical protein